MRSRHYLTYFYANVALFLGTFAFMGCVKEDVTDCGILVQFKFDKNVDYINQFGDNLSRVDLYIYDEDGNFLESHYGEASNGYLSETFEMKLTHIKPGRYSLVAWGNLSNVLTVTPQTRAPTTVQSSTLNLNVVGGVAPRTVAGFSLFHGYIGQLIVPEGVEWTQDVLMDLTKFTNHIELTTIGLPQGEVPEEFLPFKAYITSKNGDYYFNGTFSDNKVVTYQPYAVDVLPDLSTTVHEFDILRELNNNLTESRLYVTYTPPSGTEPEQVLLDIPLVDKLIEIGGDALNPKNTKDLDRDDVFRIEAEFDLTNNTVVVYINGWEVIVERPPIIMK